MFTGIVEEVGTIERMDPLGGGYRFRVSAPRSSSQLKIHDSVSINGACHTVVNRSEEWFDVESVEETLKKTSLGGLKTGSRVNLELPMRLNERLGGHLVLGHVDTTGTVAAIDKRESSWMISISYTAEFRKYIIPVGSVCVDGVSLTVAKDEDGKFIVSIIPHTMENTIFHQYTAGSKVNLEFDMVGKYIERMIGSHGESAISEEYLRDMGF